MIVDDFLNGDHDQFYISFTEFVSMSKQNTVIRKILPLEVDFSGKGQNATHSAGSSVFSYEPDQKELLDEIIPGLPQCKSTRRCFLHKLLNMPPE